MPHTDGALRHKRNRSENCPRLSNRIFERRLIEYAHEKTTSANTHFGCDCRDSSVRPARVSELVRRCGRTHSLERKRRGSPEEVLDRCRWKNRQPGKTRDGPISGNLRSPAQTGL